MTAVLDFRNGDSGSGAEIKMKGRKKKNREFFFLESKEEREKIKKLIII